MAVGADGVQVGWRAVPAAVLRPVHPGWMGVSCHGEAELRAAEKAGADHLVVSPVFGVPEKGAPLGIDGLRALVRIATCPVVALGGIGPENAAAVAATGVAGLAAIRSIRDAPNPGAAVRSMADAVTRP
jgi:thiamine-phosphate pyrophosphorylase